MAEFLSRYVRNEPKRKEAGNKKKRESAHHESKMERMDSGQPRTPRRKGSRKGARKPGRQRTQSRSDNAQPPSSGTPSGGGAPPAAHPSTSSSSSSSSSSSMGSVTSSTSFSSSTSPSASRLPPNSLFPLFAVLGREEEKELGAGAGGAGGPVQIDRPTKILMELDRGLRSPRTSDQCEAIFFFARLISTYPWPIIVNTAALKLADLFRNRYAHRHRPHQPRPRVRSRLADNVVFSHVVLCVVRTCAPCAATTSCDTPCVKRSASVSRCSQRRCST